VDSSTWSSVLYFRTQGYLRLATCLDSEQTNALANTVANEFAALKPPLRMNDRGEPARLDSLIDRDPIFLEVLRSSTILEPLSTLLGDTIEVTRHRHNHATLNRREDIPFRLHRDTQQWSRAIVNVFVYLEETSVDNGCTYIVPGSHLLPHLGPQSGDGAGVWADEYREYEFVEAQALPVPMRRGGVLLLDSMTFHSVGRNRTEGTRRSLVFACHSADQLVEHPDLESAALLTGQRRFRGNSRLQVSGSLRDPSIAITEHET
jgi:ectoine hydroxylase-related dioxygenase (phytanoyl-CoA dioxygenase family)